MTLEEKELPKVIHAEKSFLVSIMFINAECGFDRSVDIGDNGTITSPGYPNATYDNSEQCVWTFRKGFGRYSLALRFTDMAIERHGECLYDYVKVGAGQCSNNVTARVRSRSTTGGYIWWLVRGTLLMEWGLLRDFFGNFST